MKKVSVGVFAILTAFVVVKSGRAEIASQGYVDSQVYHLASKEYVDTNFQKLNKKVTSDNYEQLVEDDEIPMTDLYTSLEYVDSQNALDEKVSNKIDTLMSRLPNAMTGKKNGAFEDWFSSEISDPDANYLSASATRTLVDERLWELSYNAGVSGPTATVERPVRFITDISQRAGLIAPVGASFLESLVGDGVNLWNAPTGKAVKEYVSGKIEDIETGIGADYQKLSERVATDTELADNADKDALYPTLAKTEELDAETLQSAKDYTDGRIQDIQTGIGARYQTLDEKLTSADTTTVVNDTNKDKLYPTVGKVREMDAEQTATITEAYEEADAATLQSAQDYADEKDTAQTTAITGAYQAADATTLQSAQDYADEKDTAQTTAITGAYQAADAATLGSAKAYTDAEIEKIETGIGTNYQKLTERVATTTQVADDANKDALYPTLAKTEELINEKIAQLQAIVNVPAKCANKNNYCVLTTNGTNFVWEVIERSTSVDFPEPEPDSGEDAERMLVYEIPAE